jgi:hypothetical protein
MNHSPKASTCFLLTILLTVTIISAGCSPRRLMVDEFVGLVQTGLPAVEQEDDLTLLAQSMPAHIKLLETLLASDPHNRDLLVLLARLYGGYAFAILETESEARRLEQPSVVALGFPGQDLEETTARYYQRGCAYALRALESTHPQAGSQLNRLQAADEFMASLGLSDMPALFWYGFNLGGYVQHSLDSVAAVAKAHLVEKAMNRVVELDEGYYYGSAHLALLVYYGSRPPMMGGSPEKARRQWERHQQLSPGFRGLRDLYLARYVLVQAQDRAEFVKRLSAISRDPDEGASTALLAKVAAVRARIYLGAVDTFFD